MSTSFPGYWLVGRELAAGTPVVHLYDDAWLAGRMAEHGFPRDRMLGPPPLALTALPVCWLPYRAARSLWVLGLLTPALVGGVTSSVQPVTRTGGAVKPGPVGRRW